MALNQRKIGIELIRPPVNFVNLKESFPSLSVSGDLLISKSTKSGETIVPLQLRTPKDLAFDLFVLSVLDLASCPFLGKFSSS